jgi:tetratricopeptide (TPR) repeat protein
MEIDPSNPVVQFCVEGAKAEAAGKAEEALSFYMQAWNARKDEYDACIASHYVARFQKTPEAILDWNQKSLSATDQVQDERVAAFYPSLYLNMGNAYEDLGNKDEAWKYYQLAANKLSVLPEGSYADIVRRGVTNGLGRVA